MRSTGSVRTDAPRRVLVVQELLPSYRVELFRQLAERVRLTVLFGDGERADGFDLANAEQLPGNVQWIRCETRRVTVAGVSAVWFPGLLKRVAAIRPSDVITVGAKRFVQNHLLLAAQRTRGYRLYFLQHARTYGANSKLFDVAERLYHRAYVCRFSAGLIVYTEAERSDLLTQGFPPTKVSFTQNAIDTTAIRHVAAGIEPTELHRICAAYGVREQPSVAFIGRLVPGKRVAVAVDYHRRLLSRVPSLQTIIIGDGPERDLVRQCAQTVPGIIAAGAVYDERMLAALIRRCRYVFCPGYAGLNVLHAFAHGRPFVAFRSPCHKPEFSYVQDGQNGLVLDEGQPQRNEERLAQLLLDDELWQRLSRGACQSAGAATIEGMVSRLCDALGVAAEPSSATTSGEGVAP